MSLTFRKSQKERPLIMDVLLCNHTYHNTDEKSVVSYMLRLAYRTGCFHFQIIQVIQATKTVTGILRDGYPHALSKGSDSSFGKLTDIIN